MRGNTTHGGTGLSSSAEWAVYDALPPVVKQAFQSAPANFSAAALVPYAPALRMRKACTDGEYAAWLSEQFMYTYQQIILPKALEEL